MSYKHSRMFLANMHSVSGDCPIGRLASLHIWTWWCSIMDCNDCNLYCNLKSLSFPEKCCWFLHASYSAFTSSRTFQVGPSIHRSVQTRQIIELIKHQLEILQRSLLLYLTSLLANILATVSISSLTLHVNGPPREWVRVTSIRHCNCHQPDLLVVITLRSDCCYVY